MLQNQKHLIRTGTTIAQSAGRGSTGKEKKRFNGVGGDRSAATGQEGDEIGIAGKWEGAWEGEGRNGGRREGRSLGMLGRASQWGSCTEHTLPHCKARASRDRRTIPADYGQRGAIGSSGQAGAMPSADWLINVIICMAGLAPNSAIQQQHACPRSRDDLVEGRGEGGDKLWAMITTHS